VQRPRVPPPPPRKGSLAERAGHKRIPVGDFPTVDDGVQGMAFIETVLASHRSRAKWTRMRV
jgi:hypothetical protein